MLRILVGIVIVIQSLFSIEIKLNHTSDIQLVKDRLNNDSFINKLQRKVSDSDHVNAIYEKYVNKKSSFSSDTDSKDSLMQEFALLKSFLEYKMNYKFSQKNMILDINRAALKEYKNFSLPLTFLYKVDYKNENQMNNDLQAKILDNIIDQLGVSYVTSYQVRENGRYTEFLDESKFGIVKPTSKNMKFERKYKANGQISLTGIISVEFYPFYRIKKSIFNKKGNITNNSKSKIRIKLIENDQLEYEQFINKNQYEKILNNNLVDFSQFNKSLERFSSIKRSIEERQKYYHNVRMKLFPLDKNFDTFSKLKKSIDKRFKKKEQKSLSNIYVFKYDLSKNAEFGAAYSMVTYQLTKDIKNYLVVRTIDGSTTTDGTSYEVNSNNMNLVPLFDKVKAYYYIENNQPKIVFLLKVNYDDNNFCKSMIKGKSYDPFIKANFVRFEYNNNELEIMEHEVSKGQFKKFLNTIKDDEKKTFFPFGGKCFRYFNNLNNNMPVSCVTSSSIKKYIKWLNKNSDGPIYRLPNCEEWKFIASCNGKNKYCWGNEKKSKNENIRSLKACKIKNYKPNGADLYDMCGNVSEYCLYSISAKRTRLKVIGGNYKSSFRSINKITKFKNGRKYGFRIIREN